MTFIDWILRKLKNRNETTEDETSQIPLYIDPIEVTVDDDPQNEDKEDKRVIIIDI